MRPFAVLVKIFNYVQIVNNAIVELVNIFNCAGARVQNFG
jgi:hypothetical protein